MSKQRLAGIISAIFDPLIEGPILLVILCLTKSSLPFIFLLVIILIDTLLPVLFMLCGLKRGFISDWETTSRYERHSLNLFCLLVSFFNLFLFYLSGELFLFRVFLVFSFLMLFYTLITLSWKISGHMTANTAFVLALNIFFAWRFWWLIGLLPMVAWARLIRNKHNIWQLLGGVVLSTLVISCATSFLF